jgi:ankyrin repeat protein
LEHPDIDVEVESNREMKTVLHYACQYGSGKVAALLIADGNGRSYVNAVDKTVNKFPSPFTLHTFLLLIIKFLSSKGKTPLHLACEFKQFKAVSLLLRRHVPINLHMQDDQVVKTPNIKNNYL